MAKETKQDRIVRTIFDQTTEHFHELKNLEANPGTKEVDVERWCQSFLKACLGYSASAGYVIKSQETKGKLRPDLVVYKNDKPVFVVEVKKFGFDLEKSELRSGRLQLSEYLYALGDVRWGILTNGTDWRLYDFSQPQYGSVEINRFDLKSEDEFDLSKKAIEDECYDLLDMHESSFRDENWPLLSKEATAFSPESLSKAILSSDVVRYIAKSIKGEHDFKANPELLTDKVYSLLEKGLNDAILGWNETKALEFQKYMKSQKRTAKRTRRKKISAISVDTTSNLVSVTVAQTQSSSQDPNQAA